MSNSIQVTNTIRETRQAIAAARKQGKTIGFVPTMGALHDGHLELMRRAREECGFVVVSIFVNPTQFGPNEDFQRYPRDFDGDARKVESVGSDLIFNPGPEEMYPEGFTTYINLDGIADLLEGASRPVHFRGVATVVGKLFNIVAADKAYFGAKDYQQLKVIQRMVRDLDFPVEIVPVETVREADGLAMSSRNAYLSPEERAAATVLYKALRFAGEQARAGERDGLALERKITELIDAEPLAVLDYAAVVDPETLESVENITGPFLVALAARVGKTRLIDNMLIHLEG